MREFCGGLGDGGRHVRAKTRRSQATAADTRRDRWRHDHLTRILVALRDLPEPRTAKRAEAAIPGYSYTRHVYGHRRLVSMACPRIPAQGRHALRTWQL